MAGTSPTAPTTKCWLKQAALITIKHALSFLCPESLRARNECKEKFELLSHSAARTADCNHTQLLLCENQPDHMWSIYAEDCVMRDSKHINIFGG